VSCLAEALKGGFADSTPLQIFGPRMAAHRFEPHSGTIALMKKDAELAGALAARTQAIAPMLERALGLYRQPGLALEADLSRLIGLYEGTPQ
jgi:3-hydroxyisobutyrate dehydrogenase